MGKRRKAETEKARSWDGTVAANDGIDECRHWVVWGTGPRTVDALRRGRTDDLADTVANGRDDAWARDGDPMRWSVVVEADEDDVDAWVQEDESARGYAPFLVRPEFPERGVMHETLRDDVSSRNGRRDAGRPS